MNGNLSPLTGDNIGTGILPKILQGGEIEVSQYIGEPQLYFMCDIERYCTSALDTLCTVCVLDLTLLIHSFYKSMKRELACSKMWRSNVSISVESCCNFNRITLHFQWKHVAISMKSCCNFNGSMLHFQWNHVAISLKSCCNFNGEQNFYQYSSNSFKVEYINRWLFGIFWCYNTIFLKSEAKFAVNVLFFHQTNCC